MRKNDAARRSSMFEDLFGERQVYLRSGLISRYVVLSRPLQIAVAAGAALVLLWLAFASYGAIGTQLEVAEQRRELVRLERENQRLRAAAEAAPSAEELVTLEARIPELEGALAEVTAARERLAEQAAAATAEVVELERELGLAKERNAELEVTDPATSTAATAAGDQPPEELAPAEAEIAELNQALAEARATEAERSAQQAAAQVSAEQRIEELSAQLAAAEAETRRLQDELEAALENAAALRQTADTAEADRAELRDEVVRLRERLPTAKAADQDLAELKQPSAADADQLSQLKASPIRADAPIEALNADRAAAKGEIETVRGQPAAPTADAADGPQQDDAGGLDELERLRAELRAANQRIGELENTVRSGLTTLAPRPPPAAPR